MLLATLFIHRIYSKKIEEKQFILWNKLNEKNDVYIAHLIVFLKFYIRLNNSKKDLTYHLKIRFVTLKET